MIHEHHCWELIQAQMPVKSAFALNLLGNTMNPELIPACLEASKPDLGRLIPKPTRVSICRREELVKKQKHR